MQVGEVYSDYWPYDDPELGDDGFYGGWRPEHRKAWKREHQEMRRVERWQIERDAVRGVEVLEKAQEKEFKEMEESERKSLYDINAMRRRTVKEISPGFEFSKFASVMKLVSDL